MDRKGCRKKDKQEEFKVKIVTEGIHGCVTKIKACEIPYTITRKGPYILCDDIVPPRDNGPPIIIATDDVTLDLGAHIIDLEYRANVGIFIATPNGLTLNNVVVENGTIKNSPLTQPVAVANDIFFPLVATDPSGTPLPIGPSTIYPLTTIGITVAGILAKGVQGA